MVRVSKKKEAQDPPEEVSVATPEEHVPCVLIAMQHATNRTDRSNATKMAAAEVIMHLLCKELGATMEDDGDFTFIRIPDIPGNYARAKKEVLNRVDIYGCHPGPGAKAMAEKLSEKFPEGFPEDVLGWKVLTGQMTEMFMRYGMTKVFS
jgi:hypothetical protein